MLRRSVLAFLFLALTAIPALSRADQTQWEVLRVYSLPEGRTIAVGVPSDWQPVGDTQNLGAKSVLRFLDETGNRIEIPMAALVRASGGKGVLWAEDARKFALKVRNWS